MSWNQLGTTITGQNSDGVGASISLSSDGTTLAIGAPGVLSSKGQVRVYKRSADGTSWSSPTVATGSADYDEFGRSVSLSSDGTILAIGAPGALLGKGQVSISKYNGTSWSSQTIATGSANNDQLGYSVSLSSDGTILAIGAVVGGDGYSSGKALVYKYIPPTPTIPSPTITNILPVSGAVGTSVTITGTNLSGATSVTFGAGVATISVNSQTGVITCIAPSGQTGLVDVIVTTPGGAATSTFLYTVAPVSNICFPAGIPITCNQGDIPIEQLNPEIHTIRGKKIVCITKTVTQDKYLVCFEKDALQKNIPSEKTIISKNHGIFYKGEMVKANDFINDFENVKKVKYTGEVLYNVLMEQPDKMMVNNLICETLNPENIIAKLYSKMAGLNLKQQDELINSFNKYVIKNDVYNKKYKTIKIRMIN